MLSGYTPVALLESAGCESARDDDQRARTVERLGTFVYTTKSLSGRGGRVLSLTTLPAGGSAPPDRRNGPTVCLRGTRSLKTEQDEEADQSASLRRHGDRWTPVRLACPSGCARFNEYPVAWSFIAETRAAFGPAATDHKTDRSDGSLRYLSFRALSKLVPGLRPRAPSFHGEFDPGSGRTLAACLTHASRARKHLRV